MKTLTCFQNMGRIQMLFLLIILFTFLYVSFVQQKTSMRRRVFMHNSLKSISCYKTKGEILPDIADHHVRPGKSIFFHETSCRSAGNEKITILKRQACSVESAARLNPNYDVYLLYSSPGIFKFNGSENDRILQRLLEYSNVKILHLNYEDYMRRTPLEELYASGKIDSSIYPAIHASDVIRYLTLYKYGGIYLDLDVLVIKSLENLDENFSAAESDLEVGAGAMRFSHEGIGHEHATSCIEDLKHKFDSRYWSHNGPGVITRLSRKLCGAHLAKDMLHKDCQNYTVYPRHIFYPVPYPLWPLYFSIDDVTEVLNMCRKSYAVHVWNRLSGGTKIPVGERTAYTELAKVHCPKVFKECDKYF